MSKYVITTICKVGKRMSGYVRGHLKQWANYSDTKDPWRCKLIFFRFLTGFYRFFFFTGPPPKSSKSRRLDLGEVRCI